MDPRNHDMLCSAREAVALACRVTRAVQQRLDDIVELTKDDRSPVTVADYAAQAVIAHHLAGALRTNLANLRIVGEESAQMLRKPESAPVLRAVVEAVRDVWLASPAGGPPANETDVLDAIDACDHDASARAYWTLDPVDGTKGFLRGEQYAVSLAWIEGGRVMLGVMGCPNLSEDYSRDFSDPDPEGTVFFAFRGEDAWSLPLSRASMRDRPPEIEGRPVRARPAAFDARIRICESVESEHTRHDATARIVEHLGGAGEAARLDSQTKYAVVARGQADAYLRLPNRPGYVEKIWDHAAGALIATEAGAMVTDIEGKPLDFSRGPRLEDNRGIICAAPGWHEPILAAIRELELAVTPP